MGNSLSTAEIDVEECANLALAVALSQQPEPADPAPVDPQGESMAAAVAKAAGVYLRRCNLCGEVSYLRQGVCLSPYCRESYLSLSADEVGKRLQSWGSPTGDSKADAAQMESKRLKRLAHDDPQTGGYKRSKGQKHREWTKSFREGRHPRTGEDTTKPVWWKGGWWLFQPKVGWIAVSHEHAPNPPEPTAPSCPEPKAPEPKAIGYGPKAPEPTPEAMERLRRAQQLRDERLEEQ